MQLRFGVNDEEAFCAARDQLLDRFEATGAGDDDPLFGAQLALDWKWGYGDGDLGRWVLADLDDFLLAWCPRKVLIPAEDSAALPAGLASFLTFLHDEGLLSSASAPLPRLVAHLAAMGPRVAAAMSDRSHFGMTKSIFAGMAERGELPDGPDPDAFGEVMERFNALPLEAREQLLGLVSSSYTPWEELAEDIDLPPVPDIPDAEVAALAQAAPIIDRVRRIREFIGPGRKLTAKGNLNVADAKALAAILDDPSLALAVERGFSIRSADELPQMQFLLRWARAAGAIRVAKGKMLTTSSWAKLDPTAAVTRATSALLDKGPLAIRTADNQWAPRALIQVIDEGVPYLLAILWALPEGMDFEDLFGAVQEACELQLSFNPYLSAESRARRIRSEVEVLFALLALAGVAVREGEAHVTDEVGIVSSDSGVVSLTTLGRAVLGPYLADQGFEIPVPGELADQPLSTLFEHIGEWHPDRTRAEFDRWAERHSADDAIEEMTALLGRYTDPQWPVAALDLAGRLGPPAAERAVRRFLDTPAGGHAAGWLAEHGHTDVAVDPQAMLRAGVELMAMFAGGDDDDELLDLISALDDLDVFIEEVAAMPTPEAATLLEGISRVHPDQAIARSARKAAFRHRSRRPGRDR